MDQNFNTPILLIIFNRPKETQQLFSIIQKIKPKKLYLAADGPRINNKKDYNNCEVARNIIINNINWPCELKTLIREKNLGCGMAVSSAISWFFEQETEGIILEDDCHPYINFFKFCEELLEHYRDNEKIFMISGNNINNYIPKTNNNYYFTHIPSVWGWATWRRSWKKYDFSLKNLDQFKQENKIKQILKNNSHQKYWLNFFDEIKNKKINNWDYQLTFTSFFYQGLCIRPKYNLVNNVGQNIISGKSKKGLKNFDLNAMSHPQNIEIDHNADIKFMNQATSIKYKLKQLLKSIKIFYILKKIYKKL